MGVKVHALADNELIMGFVQPWRRAFPHAGHVFEFTINATSADLAVQLRRKWNEALSEEDAFVQPVSGDFPRLTSFAVRIPSKVEEGELTKTIRRLEDAWKSAIRIDSNADIVGQHFCAYGEPRLEPRDKYVAGLSQILTHFRTASNAGNLSYPSAEDTDERIEFFDPQSGQTVDEAAIWRSDFSQNTWMVLFAVGDDFDYASEHSHLEAVTKPTIPELEYRSVQRPE